MLMSKIKSIGFVFLLFFLAGCSTKKDSLKNRYYHNLTAWFNTLFNGQEAINQKLKELESSHQDNYFEILNVDPISEFKENNDSEVISYQPGKGINMFSQVFNLGENKQEEKNAKTGFEKAEEKALKAIAEHSMLIRGKERNRLMARAYLMLGQARYYQGKSMQALEALREVQKLPFDKHHHQAIFFEALALQQSQNDAEALEKLAELAQKDLNKKLKAQVFKHLAQSQFLAGDESSAIENMKLAIDATRNKKQQARLNFILAQYLTHTKAYKDAAPYFAKAYKLKPGFEMEARAKLFKALNFQPEHQNYFSLKEDLQQLLKKGTYKKYYNEFYYGLGKLELKRDSLSLAKNYFEKALLEDISDERFRGETFAEMADIYFRNSDYIYAAAYYDSAVAKYPESTRKTELQENQKALNSIKSKYYTIRKNDSIIAIAKMEPKKQEEFFKNFIENLKIQDENKINQEQEINQNFYTDNQNINFSFEERKRGKFYFYNLSTQSAGEQKFINLWGNRGLNDDWRFSTATASSIEQEKAMLTGVADTSNPRRYEVSYYIEKIPSPKLVENLKVERDSLSLLLGVEYYEVFKNQSLANQTLKDLLNSPPARQEVKEETLYQLYRINTKDETLAQQYKNQLISEFPKSIFSQYLLHPQKSLKNSNSTAAMQIYNQIYDLYAQQNFEGVHELYQKAQTDFAEEPIFIKIEFIEAFSLIKTHGAEDYLKALERISTQYTQSPEAQHARQLINDFNAKFKKNPNAIIGQ